MKVSIFVRSSYFSLASCALSVVPIAASAGTMPPRTIARPASAPFARSRSGAHVRRHLLYCSPAANGFVSVSSSGNIAGANFSGDAAGQSNQNCGSLSIIGGGETNLIYNDVSQSLAGESMVGAGNDNSVSNAESFVGAGSYNDVTADQAFIGAGGDNQAGALAAFVGAGYDNEAEGTGSFVGGGYRNYADGAGSVIAGGDSAYYFATGGDVPPGNHVTGSDSFVGAGDQNAVDANVAFVGSGLSNSITTTGTYAAIAGGARNTVSAEYGSILGGYGNRASGTYAVLAGGNSNTAAGELTLAAGYHADAGHNGSFVWSDYVPGSAVIADTASNQFVARASGGVYFYSNEAATAGVELHAGSGSWASLSDRRAKTDIVPLDGDAVLAKLATLPLSTWRYKTESGVRHAGPMAQDFYAAFNVGEDDRHITSIDEDGIALSAVQALYRENGSLRRDDASMHRENRRLYATIERQATIAAKNEAIDRQAIEKLGRAVQLLQHRAENARP